MWQNVNVTKMQIRLNTNLKNVKFQIVNVTKCEKIQNVIKCKHDKMQNQHITNVIKNAKIRYKFSLIKELYIKGT